MTRNERLNRVIELTSVLIDGDISQEERSELNDLLRGDPEACELYLDLSETHAALILDHVGDDLIAAATAGQLPDSKSFSGRNLKTAKPLHFRRPLIPWQTFAAAAIILLLNTAFVFFMNSRSNPEPVNESEWVAVLSRLVEPEWEASGSKYEQGSPLGPGSFRLKSGLAQIEFFSGASVIVEGPAELELISPWLVHCHSGRLRTSVPEPAQGFAIVTPEYRAVDLGTEFALSVDPDGRSELHVVEGEVRLDDDSGNELQHLTTGAGIRSAGGKFEAVSGGGTDFIDREKLLGLARADRTSRYQSWLASRNALRADPATLVFFDFEDQNRWDRQLNNRNDGASDGAIIGAQWVTGRWPGKGALTFKRITDRVRLNVPGTFESLTMAAWVKIEGLDKWYSSILLTDGFEDGEVHWQISDEGQIILGIGKVKPTNTISAPVIHPGDLGRWIHLAVTIDRASQTVTQYVDGEIVEKHHRSIPDLRIGAAEIGNWQPIDKHQPIRSLNGRLDEFVILERSMNAQEIHALYTSGLPNG